MSFISLRFFFFFFFFYILLQYLSEKTIKSCRFKNMSKKQGRAKHGNPTGLCASRWSGPAAEEDENPSVWEFSPPLLTHQHKISWRETGVEQWNQLAIQTCRKTQTAVSRKGTLGGRVGVSHRSPAGRSSCPAAPVFPPREPAAGTG